jgi:ADP-heptose:LPS heptosyltransferase
MASPEEHLRNIRELIKDINEKIRSDLIVERQKIIGFATSEITCDLFALLLHKKNLISPGFNVNHRFFSSEKSARERFNFDFPKKAELIPLLVSQENYRILLCYGRSKERKIIEEAIENMLKVKRIVESEIGEIE